MTLGLCMSRRKKERVVYSIEVAVLEGEIAVVAVCAGYHAWEGDRGTGGDWGMHQHLFVPQCNP